MAKTNSVTSVTGKSGQGKSYLLGGLAEQSNKPRVILDKKDEHQGLAAKRLLLNRERFNYARKLGFSPFFHRLLDAEPSVRIVTHGLAPKHLRETADGLAGVIHERGNMLFMASEYHVFAPNGMVPENVEILHTDARTCQVDILFDCQRAALLDTTVISQANRRITFALDDPNDLSRIAPYFHNPDQTTYRNAEEAIKNLRPRECLWLNTDTGEQHIVHTDTMNRRVPHHG